MSRAYSGTDGPTFALLVETDIHHEKQVSAPFGNPQRPAVASALSIIQSEPVTDDFGNSLTVPPSSTHGETSTHGGASIHEETSTHGSASTREEDFKLPPSWSATQAALLTGIEHHPLMAVNGVLLPHVGIHLRSPSHEASSAHGGSSNRSLNLPQQTCSSRWPDMFPIPASFVPDFRYDEDGILMMEDELLKAKWTTQDGSNDVTGKMALFSDSCVTSPNGSKNGEARADLFALLFPFLDDIILALRIRFNVIACQGLTSCGEGKSGTSQGPRGGDAERGGISLSRQSHPCGRKRAGIFGKGAPGGSDEDTEEDEPNRKRLTKLSDNTEEYLACPFFKRKPVKHQTCSKSQSRRIKDVKQHLHQCHTNPPPHCNTCFTRFTHPKTRDCHQRKGSCEPREPEDWECLTELQLNFLKQRVPPGYDRLGQWNHTFTGLFPGEPLPATPYSTDLREWEAFLTMEGPVVLQQLWGELLPEYSQPPREKLKCLFQRSFLKLCRQYHPDRSLSYPAPTAASQNGSENRSDIREQTSEETTIEDTPEEAPEAVHEASPDPTPSAAIPPAWDGETINPVLLTVSHDVYNTQVDPSFMITLSTHLSKDEQDASSPDGGTVSPDL